MWRLRQTLSTSALQVTKSRKSSIRVKNICVKIYLCENISVWKNWQKRTNCLRQALSTSALQVTKCHKSNIRVKKGKHGKNWLRAFMQQCRTWGEREQLIPLSCSASLAHNCLEYIHISLNWAIYQQIFTCLVFGIFINLRFGEYLSCWGEDKTFLANQEQKQNNSAEIMSSFCWNISAEYFQIFVCQNNVQFMLKYFSWIFSNIFIPE